MEISVEAKANSTTGGTGKLVEGLGLQPGDLLIITCDFEDKWKLNGSDEKFNFNANGSSAYPVSIGNAAQSFSAGAMVGSFNNGETYFPVGTFCQITVVEGGQNPELRLYCADSDYENNSGFIKAMIKKAN